MSAHTTTPASRRVQSNQTKHSKGPSTFAFPRALVHAESDSAVLNYFQGTGGAGAPPFFQGTGGAGAPPFAIITEPSPCATTTVFRLIAPTRTSMARKTTVSLRDIVPPSINYPGGIVFLSVAMSSSSRVEPVTKRYTLSRPIVSISFRLP